MSQLKFMEYSIKSTKKSSDLNDTIKRNSVDKYNIQQMKFRVIKVPNLICKRDFFSAQSSSVLFILFPPVAIIVTKMT